MGAETGTRTSERFGGWRHAGEAEAAVAMVDEAVMASMDEKASATAPIDIVSSGPVSAKRRGDRPFDSGYGHEDAEEAMRMAKREALRRADLPLGCEVRFVVAVPYGGTEPLVEVVPVPEDFRNLPA